jgi:hypothetical protein
LLYYQPKYDQWQIWHVVGKPYNNSVINEYGNRLVGLMGDRLLQNNKHGAFVDACTHHCTSCSASGEDSWNGENVKSTTEKLTPSEAFAKWYDRPTSSSSSTASYASATAGEASSSRAARRSTSNSADGEVDQAKESNKSKGTSNREKGKEKEKERESKSEGMDEKSRYRRVLFDEQEAVQDGQGRIFIQSHKYPCKECCICRP